MKETDVMMLEMYHKHICAHLLVHHLRAKWTSLISDCQQLSAADSDRKATTLMMLHTHTHTLIRVNLLSDSKLWRSYTTTVLCWWLLTSPWTLNCAALTIVLCSNKSKIYLDFSLILTHLSLPESLILIFVFYRFLLCSGMLDQWWWVSSVTVTVAGRQKRQCC